MADEDEQEGKPEVENAKAAAPSSPNIFLMISGAFMTWMKTTKAKVAIVGFIIIGAGLAGLFNFQASSIDVVSLEDAIAGAGSGSSDGGGSGKDPFAKYSDQVGTAALSGSTQEAATSADSAAIGDMNVFEVTVTLTWTDEADSARHTNQPDSFSLEVISPDGRKASGSGSNSHGSEGSVVVTLTRDITKEVLDNKDLKKKTMDEVWSGDWNINVTCTAAGDQEAMFSILGFRDQPDSGNAWNVDVEWTFKADV
jgi:hypothetical protein